MYQIDIKDMICILDISYSVEGILYKGSMIYFGILLYIYLELDRINKW